MKKKTLIVVIASLIVSCVVFGIFSFVQAVLGFPERHARSCLVTITEIADRAVNDEIPNGLYGEAIFGAEYIESYYPVGMVLQEDHPFAEQYREERRRQIDRITEALKDATGVDFRWNWRKWKQRFGRSRYEGGDD